MYITYRHQFESHYIKLAVNDIGYASSIYSSKSRGLEGGFGAPPQCHHLILGELQLFNLAPVLEQDAEGRHGPPMRLERL